MSNSFVKYKDLLTIHGFNAETNKEEFILLPLKDEFVEGLYQKRRNMLEYGFQIAVRKTVYEKLINVSKDLKKINPNFKVIVAYGFRDIKKQERYFNEILEEVKDRFTDKEEMYEYIHEKIAVPEVAGHPTGGAIDTMIYDTEAGSNLDFGSEILDYSTTQCYYETTGISKEARENRKLLRDVMMKNGFAPYDGEWWHFSYGDKEWAFYYSKEEALYNQVDADSVFKKLVKKQVSNGDTN